MATARVVIFDKFAGNLGRGLVPLPTSAIRAYLSNATPDAAADQYKSDLAEISAGAGYAAGGVAVGSITWQEQAGSPQGVWVLDGADFSFAASGGDIGPARYVVFYALGQGSPNELLIGYLDYGATFTITDGNSLSVQLPDGILEAISNLA